MEDFKINKKIALGVVLVAGTAAAGHLIYRFMKSRE